MQINIKITETLSRVILIDSLSIEDAITTAEKMYKNEDIVLDYADFNNDVNIEKEEDNFNTRKDLLINEVIQYLIKDEEKHYEESDEPSKHIYLT
ncbi:MAG: hypothetical protein ACI81I_000957, partial [Arcobacteraceae bacterium]